MSHNDFGVRCNHVTTGGESNETRCPFHKFAASQAAARLYGLGGYKARSKR